MIEVSQCVICNGDIRLRKRALVAPFLAARIWNREPFCGNLVQCVECGFLFYNPRLDDTDLHSLYRNYRSDEYQKMRHASEAWYTPQFNFELASEDSYARRRALLGPLLQKHLTGRNISRILDYGGDRGDLVAGLLEGVEAFVFDISGVPAAGGVSPVNDPAACQADLVINSNVLEHVGFPREVMADILAASPRGGLVFIEVPCECPFGISRILRRMVQIGVMSVTRPALALQVLRPASLYMMHEHINYFTEQTLTKLAQNSGASVIASGAYPASGRGGNADMVWCLASSK